MAGAAAALADLIKRPGADVSFPPGKFLPLPLFALTAFCPCAYCPLRPRSAAAGEPLRAPGPLLRTEPNASASVPRGTGPHPASLKKRFRFIHPRQVVCRPAVRSAGRIHGSGRFRVNRLRLAVQTGNCTGTALCAMHMNCACLPQCCGAVWSPRGVEHKSWAGRPTICLTFPGRAKPHRANVWRET